MCASHEHVLMLYAAATHRISQTLHPSIAAHTGVCAHSSAPQFPVLRRCARTRHVLVFFSRKIAMSSNNNASAETDDDPNGPDGPFSALVTAKLVSMLAIFVASLAVGCAPIVLARWLRPLRQPPPDCFYGRLVSLLLCFGGGVLLFTTFLHLLPECRRTFRELEAAGRIRPLLEYFGIEISEICVCCGFFVVYAVEETVHFVLDRVNHTNRRLRRQRPAADRAAIHRTMSMRRCAEQTDDYPDASAPSPQCVSIAAGFGHVLVNGRKLEPEPDSLPPADGCEGLRPCPLFAETEVSLFDHATDNTAMYRRSGENGDDGHVVLTTTTTAAPAPTGTTSGSPQTQACQSQTSLLTANTSSPSTDGGAPDDIRAVLRGLLAVLALSVHGVFEGLAVGLEQSPTNVWYMCVALATHKLVVVFCVGMELIGAGVRAACIVVYVCGFAVVTPAGTALGVLLLGVGGADDDDDDANDAVGLTNGGGFEVVAAVLQAMAAGTLLYVIFFEVLARDRAHPHRQAGPAVRASESGDAERHSHAQRHHYHPADSGFYRLFAIVAGFLVMFVLHLVTHSE